MTVVKRKRGKITGEKKRQRRRIWGHERACLALSLCPQLFFGSFQVTAGPSQRCFFPINRPPHLFLSFQPHFKVPEGAVKLEPAQVYKCKILQ